MSDEMIAVVCMRADGPSHTASELALCSRCGSSVWLALSTPKPAYATVICWQCVDVEEIKAGEVMKPTAEQMADIEAHMRRE